MTPEVRAIADRFIYEQATLKHMLKLVPDSALLTPTGRTLNEVGAKFAHLAVSLGAFADVLAAWRRGDSEGVHISSKVCSMADLARIGSGPRWRDDVARKFGTGLNSLISTLKFIPEESFEGPMGYATAIEVLRSMSGHCQTHAIELVDSIPEVRMDPLVLNWLLDLEFTDDAGRAWQAALLAEARAYVANHPDEEEEEEEDA